MARQRVQRAVYTVSVRNGSDASGELRFTFVLKNGRRSHVEGEPSNPVHECIVSVQEHGNGTELRWIQPPTEKAARDELEGIARQRVAARREWLERLRALVETVKGWAEELDWATRVVAKTMEDAEVGDYKAPALLLQKETVRLFLEPVARIAPGAEGVVDLYLMPSYDDIASLYYENNRWNIHYMFKGANSVGNIHEAAAKPLAKATIRKVFDEMNAHAG